MTMWYGNQAHTFDVLKVDELPFPVCLGQDTLGFGALVQAAIQDMARTEDIPVNGGVLQDDDSNMIQSTWATDPQFLQAQQNNNLD